MFKYYLALTKPGIIMGNLIAAASGFFLASRGSVEVQVLLAVLAGVALVIASGCVFNNYIDRDIDSKMERTRNRPLVSGKVPLQAALLFGALLGMAGFFVLYWWVNVYALGFALLGFFVYVVLYSVFYKRASVHGTLIGSLSGACPPVIGYVAVSNHFDIGAATLLLIFCLWQIPHSYAIAIYRLDDYVSADIPVYPVKQGVKAARSQMIYYIIGFGLAAIFFVYKGYVGKLYALAMGGMSLYWLFLAKVGYEPGGERLWARKQFVLSIVTIILHSLLISVDFVEEKHTADTVASVLPSLQMESGGSGLVLQSGSGLSVTKASATRASADNEPIKHVAVAYTTQ